MKGIEQTQDTKLERKKVLGPQLRQDAVEKALSVIY